MNGKRWLSFTTVTGRSVMLDIAAVIGVEVTNQGGEVVTNVWFPGDGGKWVLQGNEIARVIGGLQE